MQFHIITFGCQMNAADSTWLSRALTAMGWEEVSEEEAQVFILNTCSVREKPEQKVYSQLGRLRPLVEQHPGGFVAVGGCVAQQVGCEFWKRFPFVRLVFGTDGISNAPQAMARLAQAPDLRISLLDFSESYLERETPEYKTKAPAQAFVNIMQGCDNFCAYCIVPYVRGRQKSRSSQEILAECRTLAEAGTREITLLGQNVNSYGLDKSGDGTSFAELLHQVAAIDGIDRLRFTTSHPKDIAPEVIRAFGELPQLCPYLHLPLQSGSDKILASMGRKYDTARYLDIVDQLRKARPDIALSTDIIVGFPGETEDDFSRTMEMLERVRYEGSYSFKYNDRPGVRSVRMAGKVPEDVKSERLERFQTAQNAITEEIHKSVEGSRAEVILERPTRKPVEGLPGWTGHDLYNRVINVPVGGQIASADLTGTLAHVTIARGRRHFLIANRMEEL
ncbi:MAG: tRNA (N6-isopentenyl adenosine(37)-C2)-methylthiotransferase MiaB [Desulfovibrio sp.]|uniref:tRNA (N6-isopentenyl adenosine(37)-C2)-methylthiotransferase MiaB n=1 Tax=Desulfovibrio sp. 7SRBS1 TaxID=3378064 RepID=UPI003B3C86E4